MPNHITNILRFNCTLEERARIFEQIKHDELGPGTIDFNKVIPMPKSLRVTAGSMEGDLISLYMTAANPNTRDMGIPKLDAVAYAEAQTYAQRYGGGHYSDTLTDEEVIDRFSYVARRPENLKKTISEVILDEIAKGKQYVDNAINFRATTWYDWSIREWGTKWNSYDFENINDESITFNTAWSRPEPVIKKLSEMFPEISIIHSWADEDIGYNVGEIEYCDGEEIAYDVSSPGSREALEMAAGIREIDLAEYGYQLKDDGSGYEYVDEEENLGQTMDN